MVDDHFGDHLFPGWLGPDSGSVPVLLTPVEAFAEIPGIAMPPLLAPVEAFAEIPPIAIPHAVELATVEAFAEIPSIAMPAATFGEVNNTELISLTPQRRVVNF